jgi:flagellar assembly protein FliH
MLTKVVRGGEAVAAPAVNWAPVGAATATAPASCPGEAPPPDAGQRAERRNTAAALEAERREAARLRGRVAELEPMIEQRVREAHQAGVQEGRAAAESERAAEIQAALARLGAAAAQIAGLRPKLRAEAETDLVRLAIAIARRILNRELSTDPQAIAALVEAGLRKLKSQEAVRIRVHPEHKAALEAALAAAGARLEITGDPALARGDAILETARGDLDASVDTQLAEIERGLTDRLGRRS